MSRSRLLESGLQPGFCSLKTVLQRIFHTGRGVSHGIVPSTTISRQDQRHVLCSTAAHVPGNVRCGRMEQSRSGFHRSASKTQRSARRELTASRCERRLTTSPPPLAFYLPILNRRKRRKRRGEFSVCSVYSVDSLPIGPWEDQPRYSIGQFEFVEIDYQP